MKTIPKEKADYLFDHILDGFVKSHEGLEFLLREGMIDQEEYTLMLRKNAVRVIDRIHEFKNKVLSIFFAGLFSYMQVQGADLEMRRPVRTGRITRTGRSGKRNEFEPV